MIVWFIGLSDSGKTTLAEGLYKRLKPAHSNLVLLDGDSMREMFGNDIDYSVEGRHKNAERISRLCRFLDMQNIHTIAAVLSIFPEWQAWNRKNFSSYFEIFLDIPLEELKARDTKGLYSEAEAGRIHNVVGIDIPFPRPANADLRIDLATQKAGVDACIDRLLARMPSLD